jgi:hypothetical protein
MTLARNARYSEPSCGRLKPLRCRSAPCAAAAVCAAASWACAGANGVDLRRDRSQDLLGVVAQREGAHGGGGGKEGARERLPFRDDFLQVPLDECGELRRFCAARQPQQAVELALDHRVAFTRALLERRTHEHRDRAPAVPDQPVGLQPADRRVDACCRHAEHVGDQLLGHLERTGRQPVHAEKQPAAQLLLQRMMPVAYRRLRHLRDQRLGVAQQEQLERAAAIELAPDHHGRNAVGMARVLHHRAAGGRFAAHERRDADHPFVSGKRELRRGSVARHREQRNDAIGREIDVVEALAGFVHGASQRQRNPFQAGREPLVVGLRQRRKKVIPSLGGARHA